MSKDDQWTYEFYIPCKHCRKNVILGMRELGYDFRIRGESILGNYDAYKFCEKYFGDGGFNQIVRNKPKTKRRHVQR